MRSLFALTLLTQTAIAQPKSLDHAEFQRVHARLRPPAEAGWSSIAWKTSIAPACVEAVRQKQPLFMVVRSGHPLGCV